MKPAPRDYSVAISIPHSVFEDLCKHLERTGFRHDISELAETAIREWLARFERARHGFDGPSAEGYQWKRLFLPSGTLLRSIFKGQGYSAVVKGERIMMDEAQVSPSEFANACGTGRNAWNVVWLLFPGDSRWRLASDCRQQVDTRPRRRLRATSAAQPT